MKVRDLRCWPPKWQGTPRASGHVAHGEEGILIAVRGNLKTESLALTMEDEGDRYSAVLKDEAPVLRRFSLLLDWHVGRPLAKIGSLEMTP
jgi:hypothetical protein